MCRSSVTRLNLHQSCRKIAFFGLAFFRTSMLPCKVESVQSCIENFCCIITSTVKEITGYRYWGSGTPTFCTGGLKVALIAFLVEIVAHCGAEFLCESKYFSRIRGRVQMPIRVECYYYDHSLVVRSEWLRI